MLKELMWLAGMEEGRAPARQRSSSSQNYYAMMVIEDLTRELRRQNDLRERELREKQAKGSNEG